MAALLLALASCNGGSGPQGDDSLVQPDLSGDPGSADLPDASGDAVPDTAPEAVAEVVADACTPDCTHSQCGDDGCGGSCGTCPALCCSRDCTGVPPGTCYQGRCPIIDCPDCNGRECGSDGLGGTCGTCTEPHTICDELQARCVLTCDWATEKPAAWGPAGHVSALQTPADATVVKASCFDYTGDGLGDNGFKAVAGQVNGPLADWIANGSLSILFELAKVTDFTDTASFQLNILQGTSTSTPPATSGDFDVQEASYVTDNCQPVYSFAGASITGGVLATGPRQFQLSIPIQTDLVIDATLIQVQVKGTITNGADADGFEMTDGVLSGVLTQQQIDTAIAKLQASCDAAPAAAKPSFCAYLKAQPDFSWYDLHQNGDGTFSAKTKDLPGDALSVCLAFTLSKAKVVGFAP